MLEEQLKIINALGLHARAAAQLVRLAGSFKCRITIRRNESGVTANAKSILSVLHLAAGYGVDISIIADGEDEIAAVDAIKKLFADGFGEML